MMRVVSVAHELPMIMANSTHDQTQPAATGFGPSNTGVETLGATLAARRPDLTARLSAAQSKVLELLLVGFTEPQIATRLERSRHTVHDHTKAIYGVLGVSNRVQLLLLFQENRPATGTVAP